MQAVKSLLDSINDNLASDDLQLPVYSPIASKLQNLVRDPNCTSQQIERLLVHDTGLASQVLKTANSSFYSGLNKVETINGAIMRLGMTQIVSIAVMVTQKGNFKAKHPTIARYMDTLWKHSYACAVGSRWLAGKAGYPELAYEAFMSGLFHDIGELLLLKVIDDTCRADDHTAPISDALILEILDGMHAEQGHRLVKAWNLPDTYGEVVRRHHDPEPDPGNVLTLIVRVVDQAARKLGYALHHDPAIELLACPEAPMLGLSEIVLAELEILLEDGMSRGE